MLSLHQTQMRDVDTDLVMNKELLATVLSDTLNRDV
jgi:hypothetical protein